VSFGSILTVLGGFSGICDVWGWCNTEFGVFQALVCLGV